MGYILALDQGTTSSRALIVDKKAKIHGIAQKEFKQHFPQSGWVEHDPLEIWSSQLAVMSEVLAKTKILAKEIVAIGITNQRETTIIWDRKTGKPIHHAIVWQDRRTAQYCKELKEGGHEPLIAAKTGLLLDPYFCASKIRWILDHVEGAQQKAEVGELLFGTVDSWLLWNLTKGGVHVTDITNASRTLLFNIHTHEWDKDLLTLFNIPPSILPIVKSNSEVYGQTHLDIFPSPTPISGMIGDQQSSLFGQGCLDKGMIKTTYGTGAFCLLNTGKTPIESSHRLLSTIAWKVGETTHYALEGSVFMAGAAILWLRDGLGIIQKSSEIDTLANKVKSSEGVYLVPSFTGLGAPHWDPKARGTLLGLSRGTGPEHICRATLEGIAFQVYDVVSSMMQDAEISNVVMRVDGGVTLSRPLMQFQSDLLQMPIEKPTSKEMTALGACYMAGLAVGFWSDLNEIRALWKGKDNYEPKQSASDMASQKIKWQRAIECAKHWEME